MNSLCHHYQCRESLMIIMAVIELFSSNYIMTHNDTVLIDDTSTKIEPASQGYHNYQCHSSVDKSYLNKECSIKERHLI